MIDNEPGDLERLIADARDQVAATSARTSPPRDVIPGYELIRELHRGGQGVVYLAHQRTTNRDVAIKVLREGPFAGPAERARFEREVQILASLRHPHIVAIHDSGAVYGNDFFVMDYIAGLPLDQWARQCRAAFERSGTRASRRHQRDVLAPMLTIFIKIGDAVHVAHQRGVIHRDLKPTNIRIDDKEEPYVLDFGLAKLTSNDSEGTRTATLTATGDFLGTLPWSSPEQVVEADYHADIRSDVYAFGLMLYQALVGAMPYSVDSSVAGLIHAITHVEPARPRSLGKELDDDLETIVLKCLHKDPDRRYQSMAAVADDLRRYMHDEPILARRESGWYVLRMFARRHRAAVAITGTLVSLLVAASISLAYLYIRAKASEQLALRRAEETRQVAEFQAAQLAGIDTSLMGLRIRQHLLQRANGAPEIAESYRDPDANDPPGPSHRESLDRLLHKVNFTDLALETLNENIFQNALVAIDRQFVDQPLVRATLLQTLADTMRRLGLVEPASGPQQLALDIRRNALGPDHRDTMTSLHQSALLLSDLGNVPQALETMQQAVDARRRLLGEDHDETLTSLNELGVLLQSMERFDEAFDVHRQVQAIRVRKWGNDHPDVIASAANLGSLHHQRGELMEAEACYQEILPTMRRVFGNEHPETLALINNLGHLHRAQGRLQEALAYLQEAVDTRRRTLGDKHPQTLNSIDNLAGLLALRGNLPEAIALRREALDGYRAILGEQHPHSLRSLNGMCHVLMLAGKYDEALPLIESSLELHRSVLGNDHSETIVAIKNKARLLHQRGDIEEAGTLMHEALQLSRRVLGNDHPDTITTLADFGNIQVSLGQLDDAESCLREALVASRRNLGDSHPQTLGAIVKLGGIHLAQREFDEALALNQAAENAFRSSLGDDHPSTLSAIVSVGAVLKGMERWEEARAHYQEGLDGYRRALGDEHPFTLRAINLLGELQLAQGDDSNAEQFFQESYGVSHRVLGTSHPETLRSGVNLGLALCRLKRFDEAEKYMTDAAIHCESLPPQHELRSRIAQNLVELYESWDRTKPDTEHAAQAAKWRAKQIEASPPGDRE